MKKRLIRGDFVEVRSAAEILDTLDSSGSLDGLPFMPEMLPYIGKRYRVHRRVEHFSFDGDETCGDESSVRAFPQDDVVMLEGTRCSGASHDGCKRGCGIFWRTAWLREVDSSSEQAPSADDSSATTELAQRLMTRSTNSSDRYFCQSSELLTITRPLSFGDRVKRCFRNVASGNYSPTEMIRNIFVWISVRGREKLFGPFPKGELQKTPVEVLDLKAGEWVEVRSLDEIKRTLNHRGLNRGLHFAPEQVPYCGKRLRVASRADKMIMEGTGLMRSMKNTVILEDSICDSATWAFGACPREDLIYWREIWLRRVSDQDSDHPNQAVSS